jgi:hypothetical protein
MATQKQIRANQRNAKRSTGPRTIAGKKRSGGNAFRHGLSVAIEADATMIHKIETVARQVAGPEASEECIEAATDFAVAHHEIERIRIVRHAMQSEMKLEHLEPEELQRLNGVDRYEMRARTKKRRASAKLRRMLAT